MRHDEGVGLYKTLLDNLGRHCIRFDAAGSLLRGSYIVRDVEVVAWPRPDGYEAFYRSIDDMVESGTLSLRLDKNGRKHYGKKSMRLLLHSHPVDLFVCVPPAQFGVLMAIRTGPAKLSRMIVTPRSKGGLLLDGLKVKDGAVWGPDGDLIPTPKEEDFWTQCCGVPTPDPRLRGDAVGTDVRYHL